MINYARLLCFVSATSAAFVGNLNYLSPSRHHASLGVSIHRVAKRTHGTTPWQPSQLNFTHGVASGDPSEDSVILWTRAAPTNDNDASNVTVSGYVPLYDHSTEEYVMSSNAPVCVDWKIATSESLKHVIDSGTAYTSSDVDYTVKVEARKLKSFTTYYYQFSICNSENKSPVGRTKTILAAKDRISKPIKLAVYSCSNYPFGFFNAYGNPARKDSVNHLASAETPFNYDQWDGYQANRNRTFHALYNNKIGNNIFLAGDSHASWVSDLIWLDEHPYDPVTGNGSVGVEFAGSAVSSPSPAGQNVTLAEAQIGSEYFVATNTELQWQDFYYRGYYELSISHERVDAAYFGVPSTKIRSGAEISLANFTVLAGANKLHRENGAAAAGGVVEAGSLKGGKVVPRKVLFDTETDEWHSY